MAKKRKLDNKSHNQKFRNEYLEIFPFISKSTREGFAFCTVCCTDVSIIHGGRGDIAKYEKTTKHQSLSKLSKTNMKLTSVFSVDTDNSVIKSEVTFTKFLIQNNLPLSVADNAGKMFRHMFPDSKIAKKYACCRTKTTSTVHALSENDDSQLITPILKTQPFSVGTDGSNDISDKKLYPIVVRYYEYPVTNKLNIKDYICLLNLML